MEEDFVFVADTAVQTDAAVGGETVGFSFEDVFQNKDFCQIGEISSSDATVVDKPASRKKLEVDR